MHTPFTPPDSSTDLDAPAVPRHGSWLTATALLAAIASVFVLTLTGCASADGIAPSHARIDPSSVGLAAAADGPAAPLAEDWWHGFGDTQLDALVDRALAGSPTLKVAQARLDRAAAAIEGSRANEGLQARATVEAMRQRYTENGLIPKPLAGTTQETGTVQLGVSYEFDFFGRNRAAIDAAIGSRKAGEADVAATRVMLAGQVSRAYVQLARLVAQRDIAARALSQRQEMLSLIRQRVDAGLDTQVELRQGEGALPETRQQLEALDEQIALARHALAAMTAQAPDALDALVPRLQDVHAIALPQALPADLLSRRADIAAARWRVEAATQDARSVKAQFYPNVNLTAFAGVSSIGLDRLFRSGSQQYGLGPALHLPLFDSARLRANLRGKSADVDAAVESYNATVIDAVRDVADQLTSLQSIARQDREQRDAAAAAESAYDLATQRYKAGLGTFITVLNAETNLLAQRRSAADLQARALDTQVSLARALGGGVNVR